MGVVKNYLTIDGVSSEDFNIWISGGATYDSPKRDYDAVPVPGRNGDLIFDNGRFENMPLKYPAFITREFQKNIDDFRDFISSLRGYKRLEDTYHPDEYRMAFFGDGVKVKTTAANLAGEFDISFYCKPQRWLKEGERAVKFTGDGAIKNPTYQTAKPLLRVYGTGTVKIGSITITISAADVYTDIDCETMDAYKGAVNCNANISTTNDEFPTLKSGTNNIVLAGGVTRVDITPRWWRV